MPQLKRCKGICNGGGRCAKQGYDGQGIVDGFCCQHRRSASAPRSGGNRGGNAAAGVTTCKGIGTDGTPCRRAHFLFANGYCKDHQPTTARRAASPAPRRSQSPAPHKARSPSPAPARTPPPTKIPAKGARPTGGSILDRAAPKQELPQRVTRAQYARMLRASGLVLESDQDVYHIISSENGGADHPDNYHFVQNRSWNRQIGANHDHINCFMSGLIKSQKAVAISRLLGNNSGKKYEGPSAEVLHAAGANAMRGVRVQERGTWAQLRRTRAV